MSEPTTDPGKKKILVVDDDTTIRALVMLMLRHCFVKIYDARNGEEAIKVAELIRPQMILLDLTMPNMDGVEVVRTLRNHESAHLKQVPILLYTSSPNEMRQRAMAAGASAVLEKPVSKTILLQFVEMYLGNICGGGHP